MGWIVAIVCIILVVIFWRVFLPLALVAAVGLGILLLYLKVDNDRNEQKRVKAEQEVRERVAKAQAAARERIAKAKATAGDAIRQWEVSTETDPASGEKVPRNASVLSDDGLCRLQVEQRMNADRLTGIYCAGLKIATPSNIEVKFDNRTTSDRMRISRYSNGDDVYIPSSQPGISEQLPYNMFLQRMVGAKKVALLLTVEGAGQHWITFSLVGSGPALTKIGAITAPSSVTKGSAQTKPSVAQVRSQKLQSSSRQQPENSNRQNLPANAQLTLRGDDWQCVRGYRRSGSECVAVQIPQNATLTLRGDDWQCQRGYRRIGNGCVTVEMPPNATLTLRGDDWQCQRGFRRSGSECVAVQMPQNATLTLRGDDWQCQRGFRRIGNGCITVEMPPNATLTLRGDDWQCVRGYRRSGSECLPVGVSSANGR